jgi:hypothetical protein
MDSQLTLVGRPTHSHTVLVFDGESIFDARVLRLGQSKAIYTVAPTPDGCRTTVRDAQGHVAAALRFRTILPDRLSIRDGPEVTVNSWLKGRRE